ncbi:mycofactocin precursor MftA [Nocardia sp. Marseille-Q1738]
MSQPTTDPTATRADDAAIEEDLLVEEVSIDGMCGVY